MTVRPDIVLRQGEQKLLVVDAKYKLDAHIADVYQALAYCHALGLSRAVLVHPLHEATPSGWIAVRGPGDVSVCYQALDLRGDPIQLEQQGESLASGVLGLVDASRQG